MALQFTKTLLVRRDNNTQVFNPAVTSTKPTGPECDADIAAQVAAKVVAAQGNLDELAEIQSKL